MVMNLFSVFDPSSYFGLSLNWIVMIIFFIFIPLNYYMVLGGLTKVVLNMMSKISMMMRDISMPNDLALVFLSFMTLLYLMVENLLGLFPFVFTSMAHPMVSMGLGVVFWLSFFIFGIITNFRNSCAHLVPEGSPLFLSPLMVMIESVSHLIRPFTLSIRLAANMMAGHLIIGLLSSISLLSVFGFFSSLLFQSVLLILEIGVSVIQGFVFSILLLLYALEYY